MGPERRGDDMGCPTIQTRTDGACHECREPVSRRNRSGYCRDCWSRLPWPRKHPPSGMGAVDFRVLCDEIAACDADRLGELVHVLELRNRTWLGSRAAARVTLAVLVRCIDDTIDNPARHAEVVAAATIIRDTMDGEYR